MMMMMTIMMMITMIMIIITMTMATTITTTIMMIKKLLLKSYWNTIRDGRILLNHGIDPGPDLYSFRITRVVRVPADYEEKLIQIYIKKYAVSYNHKISVLLYLYPFEM